MNILVTLDENYMKPLRIMLWSLFFNNPGESFCVYLLHSSISAEKISQLEAFISKSGQELRVIPVPEDWFTEAPLVKYYSREMYYRLLAYQVLPPEVERILYLDPDILVINPVEELYNTELSGFIYAASYHDMLSSNRFNKLRLKAYDLEEYFNSGVLMMNLPLLRQKDNEKEIFEFIAKYKSKMLLPDQDILNTLYSKEIKKLSEIKYNYDVRHYQYYRLLSEGDMDLDYIMRNTSILHFCGKKKPWHKKYGGVFGSLYKHYEVLAERDG